MIRDYKLLANEVNRLIQDTGVEWMTVRLGRLTLEQEKELIEQADEQPTVSMTFSKTAMKRAEVFGVTMSYEVPVTNADKIAELEAKLAELKGEVAHA